jgi:hypothetical protein
MNIRTKNLIPLVLASLTLLSLPASADILFDNGPIDPTRTTWNDTDPSFSIFDDFTLTSPAIISGLNYHVFTTSPSTIDHSVVSLYSGSVGASGPTGAAITTFNAVGAVALNGLHTSNPVVPDGYDISLSSLAISLQPGTYTLVFSTAISALAASIASGPGSGQTIGTGLYQAGSGGGFRTGDHMAFTVIGTVVPEPSPIVLLGAPLLGLIALRRVRIHNS